MVLSAQMAKAGPPMNGKDLHIGDFANGILPAAAPLAISTLTVAGMAMAFAREGSGRVALSFIGEGGSSLGEWHEAINLCAARGCRRSSASRTIRPRSRRRSRDQSAVRVFADKAAGLRHPRASRSTAPMPTRSPRRSPGRSSARAPAIGPALIELVCMRMCGHAHHDDMLYLGKDPQPSWDVRAAHRPGIREPRRSTRTGRRAIRSRPTPRVSRQRRGHRRRGGRRSKGRSRSRSSSAEARAVIDAPWPDAGGRREGRLRRRAAARARRSARSGCPQPDRLRPRPPAGRSRRRRSIGRAAPFSKA